MYLRKPETSQNAPKPVETTQNQPKWPPKIVKRPKISKLGKYGIFIAFVFQMPKFGYFGARSINFLIFQQYFACAYFEKVDVKSDTCFRKFRAQIHKCGHFGSKIVNRLILRKLAYSLFQMCWFQISHYGCWKFRAQILKFEHFRQKLLSSWS